MKIISTHSTLENITRAVLLNLTSAPGGVPFKTQLTIFASAQGQC